MQIGYLILFLTFPLLAQDLKTKLPALSTQIRPLPSPEGLEDFEHQFKGCPENSECDAIMGKQLKAWKDLIDKLESDHPSEAIKAGELEKFRAKYGIPIEFYTHQKSEISFKPILYNSPCKNHNPKKQEEVKTLVGMSFIKAINKTHALVWRDETQFEIPLGDLLTPQPVEVYFSETPTLYQIPLGDKPLFIKNKSLYVLREEDSLFYFLKISPFGEWKIENVDFSRLSEWEEKRIHKECPKEENHLTPKTFTTEYCQTVWSEDLKKPVVFKVHRGCIL